MTLVDELFTPDWQTRLLEKYGYDYLLKAPRLINETTIAQAATMLDCLKYILPYASCNPSLYSMIERLSKEFYVLIPHKIYGRSRQSGILTTSSANLFPFDSYSCRRHYQPLPVTLAEPVLDSSQRIEEKFELLRLLTRLARQQKLVDVRMWSEAQTLTHPIDALVWYLDLRSIEWLGPDIYHSLNRPNLHPAVQMIEDYVEGSRGHREFPFDLEILSVFEVESGCEASMGYRTLRFGELEKNRRLLWHGTHVTDIAMILRNGFTLPISSPLSSSSSSSSSSPPSSPTFNMSTTSLSSSSTHLPSSNGASFGDGIYFTDCVSKAAQYCGVSAHGERQTGYLLLCEVALGDMFELDRPTLDARSKMEQARKHSVHGRGWFVPDPSEWAVDEYGVLVPLGDLVKYQEEPEPLNVYNEVGRKEQEWL
ncbi:hypothetical protein BGW42_003899 [Actinomortierella wolfii]|nr:hypothetical protein BGW42_003899 [Actinomortierella wolfii]